MKEIAAVMILLALCIPALAVNVPNMIGNWTGTAHGVKWLKNTDYQTTGKPNYWVDNYTMIIDEQNGTRFSGKITEMANPLNSEVILGIIGSDNTTIALLDENEYYWGSLKSSREMELFSQAVEMNHMILAGGAFTKIVTAT